MLITGSRGVIGAQLTLSLIREGYQVIGTKRPLQNLVPNSTEIDIEPWIVPCIGDHKIDVIVHLAAVYQNELTSDKIKLTNESNIGITSAISELAAANNIPVIALGTFIEKHPGVNGLSYYANSKRIANGILYDFATKFNFGLDYVYLYDSFSGDISRGKFIDLLIKYKQGDEPIYATGGYQVQDLTYIGDIVGAITGLIKQDNYGEIKYWQIRSGNQISLRSLSHLISEIKGYEIEVKWDHFPYGKRDVFRLWDCAENLLDSNKLMPLKKRLSIILKDRKYTI